MSSYPYEKNVFLTLKEVEKLICSGVFDVIAEKTLSSYKIGKLYFVGRMNMFIFRHIHIQYFSLVVFLGELYNFVGYIS